MRHFIVFFVLLYFLTFVCTPSFAQSMTTPSTQVTARVGDFYLTVSGFAAPYATVILSSGGEKYRTVVADKRGSFSISSVSIKRGFSQFCLRMIDVQQLGESTACFRFEPATSSIAMRGIYLPPTQRLQRSVINEQDDAVVMGYTMPGALVTIHIEKGQTYTATAGINGYYEYAIRRIKAGTYQLYVTAEYFGKQSEEPNTRLTLKSLSLPDQIEEKAKEKVRDFVQDLQQVGDEKALGPLWIAIPLLALIYLLLHKLWPKYFRIVDLKSLIAVLSKFAKPKKKLHHAWFVGY
jgi:hypothetical protein